MISLLGSLIGFIGALIPDCLKFVQDRADKKHELRILEIQIQREVQGHTNRLEEIQAQADINEAQTIYKTWQSGVSWVDALNGTVRPVLAYAFFLLYALVKMQQFSVVDPALPWQLQSLWGDEDQAIFAGIISFYFGQRAMSKVRGR
jgi:hypothetical protein